MAGLVFGREKQLHGYKYMEKAAEELDFRIKP